MPLSLTFDSPYSDSRNFSSVESETVEALFEKDQAASGSRSEYLENLFMKYRLEANRRFPDTGKPYFSAQVTYEGSLYVVEFGPNLLYQLIKLYFVYGWDFIYVLETALRYNSWTQSKPGYVVPFYIFTRKTLAIAIRHNLAFLEQLAKQKGDTNLTAFKDNFLKKQSAAYSFKLSYEPFVGAYYQTISNQPLAEELHKLVKEALSLRNALKKLTEDNKKARTYNDIINNFIAYFYGPSWGPAAANRPFSYNPIAIYDEEAKDMELKLFEKLKALAKNHVLALLLFPGLSEDYAEPDLEDELFKLNSKLQEQLQSIRQAMYSVKSENAQTAHSRVTVFLDWPGEDQLDIDQFPDFRESVESRVTAHFESVGDISLLSVNLLDDLLQSGQIEKDSFLYPVWYQYRDSLLKRMQEMQKEEQANSEAWEKAGKVSAILSLSALIPVLGEVTGPLALLIDLGILFHTACAINASMDGMQFQVDKSLLRLDSTKPEFETALYNTGFVMEELRGFKSTLAVQMGKEALLLLLGSSTNKYMIRRALHWRAYVLDIETLYL